MKWIKVYGIPVPVVETDLQTRYTAEAMPFWIRCRRGYASDDALLKHEAYHISQIWRTIGIHVLLYKLSPSYRYRSECGGHAAQIKAGGISSAEAARRIMTRYDLDKLNITESKVLRDLQRY